MNFLKSTIKHRVAYFKHGEMFTLLLDTSDKTEAETLVAVKNIPKPYHIEKVQERHDGGFTNAEQTLVTLAVPFPIRVKDSFTTTKRPTKKIQHKLF